MAIISTKLKGVYLIEPDVMQDHRGFFMESYNQQKFNLQGVEADFLQDNHSLSVEAGTLRGLHYQLHPKGQSKLVRVTSGAVYDVVVDIRENSDSFGKWMGFILSESNKRQLFVPNGFAHGFCTLVANTEVLYKVDQYYSAEHDRGIAWNDPALGIEWPCSKPILSDKDGKHPMLKNAEFNIAQEVRQ
jgi:dTDP-4-dehydrorhamnose 3,5-epimerase